MIKPQLCKLLVKPFNAKGWKWERKYDGFRALADFDDSEVYGLQARSGTDKTEHFPELEFKLNKPALLDGEIVSAAGLSFQEGIQPRVNRLEGRDALAAKLPACYMVFDILRVTLGGVSNNVMHWPLKERRALLEEVLVPTDNVQLVQQYDDGVMLFERAKASGWEGVVGKNMAQGYSAGRRLWVKVKCWLEGTFYVVGFTAGTGRRKYLFGALYLVDADGNPVGEVGTGFTDVTLAQLNTEMRKDVRNCVNGVYDIGKPFAVRIKYLEVTNAGQLRFPVYLGKAK